MEVVVRNGEVFLLAGPRRASASLAGGNQDKLRFNLALQLKRLQAARSIRPGPESLRNLHGCVSEVSTSVVESTITNRAVWRDIAVSFKVKKI